MSEDPTRYDTSASLTLANEIQRLREVLDRVHPAKDRSGNPAWFAETARQHTDERGNTEAVCVPIRAAIALLEKMAPDGT